MKNYLVIIIIFISSSLFAQKGNVILGAYSDISNQSWTNWSLTPTVGVYLSDNFVLGTGLNYLNQTDEPYEDYFLSSSTISFSPFVRFYKENLFFSFGSGLDYLVSKTEDTNSDPNYITKDKSFVFSTSASVGYSLFWGDYVCFEPSLSLVYSGGLSTFEETQQDDIKNSSPQAINIGLGLGLSVRLSK